MKCKECSACVKQGNEYVCTGIKEPFVIEDIEMECSEYQKLANFSQSGTMYSMNEDGTLGKKIGTCDMLKGKINMKHKYLQELFPNNKLPFPYGEEDYHDFDDRDTFSMDYTLVAWLYECMRFFQDETCIDLNYHRFDIDGEEFTQIQCIDRMIEDCKVILLNDGAYGNEFDKVNAAKDDLFKILSKVYWSMWW